MYEGAERGLVHKYASMETPFHGTDGFNDVDFESRPDLSRVKKNAATAIMRLVEDKPNQIKVSQAYFLCTNW